MFALQRRQRLFSVLLRYPHRQALPLHCTNKNRPRMGTPSKTSGPATTTKSKTFSRLPPTTTNITKTTRNTQSSRSRTGLLLRHLGKDESTSTSNSNNNNGNSNSNISQSQLASTMTHSKSTQPFTIRKIGAPNTLEYRIYIEKDGIPLSPFHDIPLYANDQQTILNMVVEIPRWTNAKMEVKSLLFSLNRLHGVKEANHQSFQNVDFQRRDS